MRLSAYVPECLSLHSSPTPSPLQQGERDGVRGEARRDIGTWARIIDPPMAPQANMDRDLQWMEAVRRRGQGAVLRIYRWDRPAISIGRLQALADLPSSMRGLNLPFVRRPTGGGAVVHRPDELTYALAVSGTEITFKNLRRCLTPRSIHERLREALVSRGGIPELDLCVADSGHAGPVSVCFQEPVAGDLIYRREKAGGAARRVWREGLLIQGSIQGLPVSGEALVECLTQAVLALRHGS